ncbi:hypothetical protein BC941DRAFT_467066 [Chlamydoabsidia padenii]|nr:hypothetical protein BC941DRAFT_467066 [Chlamydoabsidia padenii]
MQGNIKVVVRCRPLNARELARGATCLVKMENNQTILQNPKSNDDIKAFTFDRSYWSAGNKTDSDYADQETVYNDVGREWLDHAFAGYNCCIFAYGQTGSGKSYSMMGYGQDKGIIPRTCSELFERINQKSSNNEQQFQVEVSYIEIYNERVRDLLNPRTKHLKVREHPSLGPYVEDLSRLVVKSFGDIEHLMDEGNKARTVAATNMNETSSRSHAVFTLILTQKTTDGNNSKQQGEKVSRFSLVDLAGSERANSTGASGMRLKEGANINRSLTTLGKVIAGLAEQTTQTSANSKSNKKRDTFIPYRDSVLTWLLKDSLGGNSKTAMIAAISPADFDETLSTLRYADQAKKIKTKAVVNEDPNVRMIRDLKMEIQNLKQSLLAYVPHPEQLQQNDVETDDSSNNNNFVQALPSKSILVTDAYGNASELTKREVVDQIKSSQKLLGDINQSWEERLKTTIQIQQDREQALAELGIMVATNDMGVYTPKNTPYLVNLNEDPLMSECLVYQIKPGTTMVGQKLMDEDDSFGKNQQYIRLGGTNILENHCWFENTNDLVTIYPGENSVTMVNGIHINKPKQITSGYRIILGDHHVFRFNHPEEARREREEQQQQQQQHLHNNGTTEVLDDTALDATGSSINDGADWLYARREAVMQYFQQHSTDGSASPTSTAFDDLTNEELEKLFDDVTKLRRIRKRHSSHNGSIFSQPMSPCSSSSSFSYRPPSTTIYENGSSGISLSSITADDSDSMVDMEIIRLVREELQQQMDEQKAKYEKEIRRLSCLYPLATSSSLPPSIGYSDNDKLILAWVIQHWRDQRYVHLAETLLMNGATLYEVNALARQLKKKVVYQLTIIHNTQATGSEWEEDLCATRLDKSLLASKKPCIGVRVVDSKHQCTYLWSLDRLKTRLRYMQGIRFVTDQSHHLVAMGDGDMAKKHIHLDDSNDGDELDLFYDSHSPRFALIGMAKMRLRHLGLHVPMELTLDVFCQRTCRVVGKLAVLVAPIARSKKCRPNSMVDGDTMGQQMEQDLQVGQHLVFEIRIGALSGVDETEFTHVHTQFQLLTLIGGDDDQIYATPCASKFGKHSRIDFDYSKTFSIVVTTDILATIQHGDLTFEVYGQPQPDYLKSFQDEPCSSHQLPSVEKKYNVYAWIEVCELARVSGEYTPVQVIKPATARTGSRLDDNDEDEGFMATISAPPSTRSLLTKMASHDHQLPKGTFLLRQGHQRRIVLTIRHDWILPSTNVDGDDGLFLNGVDGLVLWLGDIRYRSSFNGTLPTAQDISIPLTVLTKTMDTLVLQGAWDSSLHNSLLLNRVTEDGETVDMTIKWIFHGAPFQMDVGVQITSGDDNIKRRSLLRSLFSTSYSTDNNNNKDDTSYNDDDDDELFAIRHDKKKTSIAGIYRVWERPRRLSSYHHQQNDSKHHEWQQHQMIKIKSYDLARQSMLTKLEVAHTRYTLALLDALKKRRSTPPPSPLVINRNDLLHTIIQHWSRSKPKERTGLQMVKAFGSTDQLESPAPNFSLYDVHQICLSDEQTGFLMHQHYGYMKIRKCINRGHGELKWKKRWFLLKRPYLLVYANDHETNELDILNIQAVRVHPSDKELVNTFTLYTSYNTYQCQAVDQDDMKKWVASIL